METWICIATYNERDTVGDLLSQIHAWAPQAQVIVVDDNSPDGTGDVLDQLAAADPWVHPIHRSGKLGYASAHRAAMARALEEGAEVVVTMDADFSHDPKHLVDLLKLIEAGANLAIGSRYVPGGGTQAWPWHRRFLSATANSLARIGLGLSVHDCTAGFRAYRAPLLRQLRMESFRSEGYCFLEEILAACARAGADIRETPIIFVERRAGRSKMSRKVILEAAWMLVRLTCRRLFTRKAAERGGRSA
jgi:dolichol-phosphate mannosyltransferase